MNDECERERIRGLPGPLPSGERILWRGAPRWQALAWRVFHVREALVWFALVAAVRVAFDMADGASFGVVVARECDTRPDLSRRLRHSRERCLGQREHHDLHRD